MESALSVKQLGEVLGVSRQTLSAWRRRFPKEFPTSNDPEEVRALMRERGLGQYSLRLNAPSGGGAAPEDSASERELRIAERRVKLEREQFELEKAKSQMVKVAEVTANLGVMVGAFNNALNAMPGRAATKIILRARSAMLGAVRELLTAKQFEKLESGLDASQIDYADIEDILRAEVDGIKRPLSQCDWYPKEDATGGAER